MVGRACRDFGEVTDAEDRGSVAAPFDTAGDEVPGVSGFLNGLEDADQVEIAGFCQCVALLIRVRISHLLVPRDGGPGRQFYNLKSRLSAIGTQAWSNIDECSAVNLVSQQAGLTMPEALFENRSNIARGMRGRSRPRRVNYWSAPMLRSRRATRIPMV